MELIQADFHQTFRICLRYTKVILKDPRRRLRISQPSPNPKSEVQRACVSTGEMSPCGWRCHGWSKQTAAFNVSPRWKITRQMELFLTWAAHAASSREGIWASNFLEQHHGALIHTHTLFNGALIHTHTLFKKKTKQGFIVLFFFFSILY